jgi:hypothetical protein
MDDFTKGAEAMRQAAIDKIVDKCVQRRIPYKDQQALTDAIRKLLVNVIADMEEAQ